MELARPADQITVGEVIRASEGPMQLLDCVTTEDLCVIQGRCKLRNVLDQAERLQTDYLQSIRLCDILPFDPAKRKAKVATTD
jgi:Rrf2 family nitric oxide-sensitive transcriptional repressor